jgi:hypothetical protein
MTCWSFKTRIQHALAEMDSLSDKERSSIEKILTSCPLAESDQNT